MQTLHELNLIHLFDFYLALMFLLSTWTRVRQYRTIVGLVRAVPGRWPRLFELVRGHGTVFLTWSTVVPGLLALLLMGVQFLASRLVWPEAGRPPHGLTLGRLLEHVAALPFVAALGLGMLAFDTWGVVAVGEVDRPQLEGYFDQAEFWLRSWTAPVVRVFTLGYINPRQMVAVEVQNALIGASRMLNTTLWWVCAQLGLRLAYGLSLWLTFALALPSAPASG